MGNLGPVANLAGHVDIQIRDLDQAVIGNPAHDLIRLALSLRLPYEVATFRVSLPRA